MSTTKPKKKPGQKGRGLETLSESSERRPTEISSSSSNLSLSSNPLSTAISALSISSSSSARPDHQSHLTSSSGPFSPGCCSQCAQHPPSSSSTRPSSSRCSHSSRPQLSSSSAGPSSSSRPRSQPSSSRRSRSSYTSSNPLLPSIPPGSRHPKGTRRPRRKSPSFRPKPKMDSASKSKLGEILTDQELGDMNYQLQLRTMELHPDKWLADAFPAAMRPLISGNPPEVSKVAFKNGGHLYLLMKKLIDEVKDGVSQAHLVMLKPVPSSVFDRDIVWDWNIAPHCRFTHLEAQQTLMLHIAKETRYMESLPSSEMIYDDTDMGVQGHALGRFKYGLKKQMAAMNIPDDEWAYVCNHTRHSRGAVILDGDPASHESTHSADRMFIPGGKVSLQVDAKQKPWPTMVIETGPEYANLASRWYLQYCADWWFTQSQGATKYVLIMYFNYKRYETIVEKWVSESVPPYTKTLAQTVVINLQPNAQGKAHVVVTGEPIILDFEALMARDRREGEKDIVFDKALMDGFGNGYLVPWPNLGPKRRTNIKTTGMDIETARKILGCPLDTLKAQLGPALATALSTAEKASKAHGVEADVPKSRMKLTLTRKPNGKSASASKAEEERIPVDLSIREAMAIMAKKEEKEEKEEK